MPHAIIVVPCYNEALRLDPGRFLAFARAHPEPRFLLVNDGSTDETPAVLESLRRADPERFAVCDLPENVGKGEAVRRGLLRAFLEAPDYVGYWDADLSTPLDAIPALCSVLDARREIAMVFGARVALLGRSVRRDPARHYLGRAFATAASLTLGIGFYDTQCGAKVFRATREVRSLFRRPFRTRWLFDVEIVARLVSARRAADRPPADAVVYEFPLHEWRDVAGSKVRPRDFARAFFELAAIAMEYRPRSGPSRGPRALPAALRVHPAGLAARAPIPGGR